MHVATNRVPKPIPPGAEMPPGEQAQTCTGCHQPWRAVGDQIRVIREYADDETNTETKTILQMYLGAASPSGRSIHWHANPSVHIEYVATDEARETIPYVKVTDAKGQVKEFVAEDAKPEVIAAGTRRTMDCIDCHNTVGHPIAPTAEIGGGPRHRRKPDRPPAPVCAPRGRAAGEGRVLEPGRRRRDD